MQKLTNVMLSQTDTNGILFKNNTDLMSYIHHTLILLLSIVQKLIFLKQLENQVRNLY